MKYWVVRWRQRNLPKSVLLFFFFILPFRSSTSWKLELDRSVISQTKFLICDYSVEKTDDLIENALRKRLRSQVTTGRFSIYILDYAYIVGQSYSTWLSTTEFNLMIRTCKNEFRATMIEKRLFQFFVCFSVSLCQSHALTCGTLLAAVSCNQK